MANPPPTASGHNQTVTAGQTIALTTLFSYAPGAGSSVVGFDVEQTTSNGGHLVNNGVIEAPGTLYGSSTFGISISQIDQWSFVGGPGGSTDTIKFNADDADGKYDAPAATAIVSVQAAKIRRLGVQNP